MRLILERDVKTNDFTLGKLSADGVFKFFTVEDRVREVKGVPVEQWKIKGETAIPVGTYRVIVNWSNRFQKHLPLLLGVKGFAGIRIHAGNTQHDTEGCILLGTRRTKDGVANSRLAMDVFMDMMAKATKRGEVTTLEIK